MSDFVLPEIREFKPYKSARDECKSEASVYLDANENPFIDETYGSINRYPDTTCEELRKELSKIKNVDPDTILFGNGSDEVIDLIFRASCRPCEDKIIICPPTYGMYAILAKLNRIETVEIPLTSDFSLDIKKILEFTNNQTKILFICNPNNPTGTAVKPDHIEHILKTFKGLVVVDEAYIDFAPQLSVVPLISKYNNLIVIQTLSKAWGLAGLRVGMMFAQQSFIECIRRIKCPYNVNKLSQNVALKRIKDKSRFANEVKTILEQRNYVAEAIKNIANKKGLTFELLPAYANFILVKFNDANAVCKGLLNHGVVVRNRTHELGLQGCVRISIGTPQENKLLIDALEKTL
jgi:histidinol-phosphate aminotransferase